MAPTALTDRSFDRGLARAALALFAAARRAALADAAPVRPLVAGAGDLERDLRAVAGRLGKGEAEVTAGDVRALALTGGAGAAGAATRAGGTGRWKSMPDALSDFRRTLRKVSAGA